MTFPYVYPEGLDSPAGGCLSAMLPHVIPFLVFCGLRSLPLLERLDLSLRGKTKVYKSARGECLEKEGLGNKLINPSLTVP